MSARRSPASPAVPAVPASTTFLLAGRRLLAPRLPPERRAVLIAFLQGTPGALTGMIAKTLGVSTAQATRWLTELSEEGLIQGTEERGQRVRYALTDTRIDAALVNDALKPVIQSAVQAGPAMASSLAARLGLPLPEVRETCRWLQAHGHLRGVRVGHAVIYHPRVEVLPLGLRRLGSRQLGLRGLGRTGS